MRLPRPAAKCATLLSLIGTLALAAPAHGQPDAGVGSEPASDTDPDTDPDTGSDPDPVTGSDTDPVTGTDPDPDPGTGTTGTAADPDSDTVGGTGDPDADPDGPVTDPTIDSGFRPPPARLLGWSVRGTLVDSQKIIEGLLGPEIERYENAWDSEAETNITEFLEGVGYHVLFRTTPGAGGGLRSELVLKPVTVVRIVEVDLAQPFYSLRRLCDPEFRSTLLRRMTLRPGSSLPIATADRDRLITTEELRILRYLKSQGFFEAKVKISITDMAVPAARVKLSVNRGPAYRIGNITVSGNTEFSDEQIAEKFVHTRFWSRPFGCGRFDNFSRQRLRADEIEVEKLYKKRGYLGVRVRTTFDDKTSFRRESKSVEFTVIVRERRRIDIRFEGNARQPDWKLREQLTLLEEGSYDNVEVAASAEAIRRYYQTQGLFEATVVTERVKHATHDALVFRIDEGNKLVVRSVKFRGNKAFTAPQLLKELKTREFARFIVGESGGYATSVQLAQDVARLRRFYAEQGFPDTKIGLSVAPQDILIDSAPGTAAFVAAGLKSRGIHIRFDVDEGVRESVALVDFRFDGPTRIAAERLLQVVSLSAGDPFRKDAAEDDGKKLQRFYKDRGLPRARVVTSFERDADVPNRVTVIHEVTANSPARIGEIALRGNFKTADWVLRKQMKLRRGQLLTLEAADGAMRGLRDTGLFAAVRIDYKGLDRPNQETVGVLVDVEERFDYLLDFEFGGGLSTERGVFGYSAVRHRNLFRRGVAAEARTDIGSELQQGEARLTLPYYLLGAWIKLPVRFEAYGFLRNEETERFGQLQSFGGSFALSRSVRRGTFRGLSLSLRYDFRQRQRDVELVRGAGASDDIEESKLTVRSSLLGPVISLDRRRDRSGGHNPLDPSAGYRLEARAQYGEDFVFGSARFIKLGATVQHFKSFGSRFLISNTFRYDQGVPLAGASLLPDVERYFAGGDSTVRGFDEDRLATEIIDTGLPPLGGVTQFKVLPAGGNLRGIYNLDFQLRLTEFVGSAVFVDQGLVANSLEGFAISDLRHSVGMALRLLLPIGKLSVSWAIPLDPSLSDNPRGRLHFNFGVQI